MEERARVLSGGSQGLALPLQTGSGRFPGWGGGGVGEEAPLRGLRVEVHSQREHSYAESPWLFGCRFLFAVTCRCLSAAAVVQILISLLPKASVEWVVQSSRQLREREARDQQRDGVAWHLGGPWLSAPAPALAPVPEAGKLHSWDFGHSFWRGTTVLSFKYAHCPTRKWRFLNLWVKGGPHGLQCVS